MTNQLRQEPATSERWNEADVMKHYNLTQENATKLMDECRRANNIKGYGSIDASLIIDYVNEKERLNREREARHKADIAAAEIAATLKVQVATLEDKLQRLSQELASLRAENIQRDCENAKAASKADFRARVANIFAGISTIAAIVALVFSLV